MKNPAGVLIHADFDKKADLASLKSDVYKLNFDILKNVPRNLSDLR